MVETKTIGYSSLGAIGVALLTLYGASLFTEPYYYCDAKPDLGAYKCDSLSAYYSLPNGKCNNAVSGNKLCTTGWNRIIDDRIVVNEESVISIEKPQDCLQYICDTKTCECKN